MIRGLQVVGYALLLFGTRVLGLFLGGWLGCNWADQPSGQGKLAFLAFVMQVRADRIRRLQNSVANSC